MPEGGHAQKRRFRKVQAGDLYDLQEEQKAAEQEAEKHKRKHPPVPGTDWATWFYGPLNEKEEAELSQHDGSDSEGEDKDSKLFRTLIQGHQRLEWFSKLEKALDVVLSDDRNCKLLHHVWKKEEIPTCCHKLRIVVPTMDLNSRSEDEKQRLIETRDWVQDRMRKLKLELGLVVEDGAGGSAKRSKM